MHSRGGRRGAAAELGRVDVDQPALVDLAELDLLQSVGNAPLKELAVVGWVVCAEEALPEGFDVGLEMSGNPAALGMMLDTMAHGGKIAMLGIQPDKTGIDWDAVVFKSLTLKGIYGREMYETWYKMAAMIQGGLDISPIITHRFPYSEFQKGFDIMRSGNSGKVILDWSML